MFGTEKAKPMFAEIRDTIGCAALAGIKLSTIEVDLIDRAPVDEEQKAALWLYAAAVTDEPARLLVAEGDLVELGV